MRIHYDNNNRKFYCVFVFGFSTFSIEPAGCSYCWMGGHEYGCWWFNDFDKHALFHWWNFHIVFCCSADVVYYIIDRLLWILLSIVLKCYSFYTLNSALYKSTSNSIFFIFCNFKKIIQIVLDLRWRYVPKIRS